MRFDSIGVINQVNVLILTHIFKVCIYLLTFLIKFFVVNSPVMFFILTSQFSPFIEHARLTVEVAMSCEVIYRIRSFVPTWRIIWFGSFRKDGFMLSSMQFVVAPEKCLTKVLQSLLTFFWHFPVIQMFKRTVA